MQEERSQLNVSLISEQAGQAESDIRVKPLDYKVASPASSKDIEELIFQQVLFSSKQHKLHKEDAETIFTRQQSLSRLSCSPLDKVNDAELQKLEQAQKPCQNFKLPISSQQPEYTPEILEMLEVQSHYGYAWSAQCSGFILTNNYLVCFSSSQIQFYRKLDPRQLVKQLSYSKFKISQKHFGDISAVECTPDESGLAVGFTSGKIIVYDLLKAKVVKQLTDVFAQPVFKIRLLNHTGPSFDKLIIVAALLEGDIYLLQLTASMFSISWKSQVLQKREQLQTNNMELLPTRLQDKFVTQKGDRLYQRPVIALGNPERTAIYVIDVDKLEAAVVYSFRNPYYITKSTQISSLHWCESLFLNNEPDLCLLASFNSCFYIVRLTPKEKLQALNISEETLAENASGAQQQQEEEEDTCLYVFLRSYAIPTESMIISITQIQQDILCILDTSLQIALVNTKTLSGSLFRYQDFYLVKKLKYEVQIDPQDAIPLNTRFLIHKPAVKLLQKYLTAQISQQVTATSRPTSQNQEEATLKLKERAEGAESQPVDA